jgi:ketosteroid isomerase-like protein
VTALRDADADAEGVLAASRAFYAALAVLDDGTAMERVWANEPYVTYVGPHSPSVIVGWSDQKRYWRSFNSDFLERRVSITRAHVRVVGNLAWEIGVERGCARMKDGRARTIDWIVTNILEKRDGRWLMVSHHVQPRPPAG